MFLHNTVRDSMLPNHTNIAGILTIKLAHLCSRIMVEVALWLQAVTPVYHPAGYVAWK